MNIILFSKKNGSQARVIHCNGLIIAVVLLIIPIAVAWFGYQGGLRATTDRDRANGLEHRIQQDRAAADNQRARDELTALTGRLGRLQAEMVRLNALGQRLVEVAGLDRKEFDFQKRPPQGGPVPSEEGISLASSPRQLAADIDRLASTIGDREQKLAVLESLYRERRLHDQGRPKGRPIRKGWISSYFGVRTDPFTGRKEMHKGLDLAGKMGSEILAVADGVVTWAGKRYGYGNLVEINHGNGYATRYGHNRRILVKPGEVVHRGQVIALMGSTGRSTGPHVHFEVLARGRQIDPAPFVRAGR